MSNLLVFLQSSVRFLYRPFDIVCCRLMLLILGFWTIPVTEVALPRNVRPSTVDEGRLIVLSNLSSPVDVLLMQYLYSPLFMFASFEETDDAVYTADSVWRCLSYILSFPDVRSGRKEVDIEHTVANDDPRPIVLFCEGTVSNNRGLLRFRVPSIEVISARIGRLHLSVCKYGFAQGFRPALTTERPWSFLWHVCCRLQNHVECFLTTGYPMCMQYDLSSVTSWVKAVRDHMARNMLRGHALELDANDRKEFLSFYAQTHDMKKSYVRK